MLRTDSIDTPIGRLHLALRGDALCALTFAAPIEGRREPTAISDAVRAYFAGDVRALERIEVDPAGTDFQRRVWARLREIPFAETTTYGALAKELGSHPRAIGSANARNPVALVIPCHRVVAKGGALCGYAFGEERKRWLLDHEKKNFFGSSRAPQRKGVTSSGS